MGRESEKDASSRPPSPPSEMSQPGSSRVFSALELLSCSAIEFGDVTSHEALLATFLSRYHHDGADASSDGMSQLNGSPASSSVSPWAKFRLQKNAALNTQRIGGISGRSGSSCLISATLYTLNPRAGPINPKPFHDAVVRITRRSVSVYRSYDRSFLIEIMFSDIKDVEQHVPAESPDTTEIAFVHARGILVLDIAVPFIASAILSAVDALAKTSSEEVSGLLQQELSRRHAEQPYAASPPFVEPDLASRRTAAPVGGHHPRASSAASYGRESSLQPSSSPAPQRRDLSRPGAHHVPQGATGDALSLSMRREEAEEIERIRRREQDMRREISLPSRSASSVSSAATLGSGAGGQLAAVARRRQEAAAQRRSSRSGSSQAAQVPTIPGPTEDIIHRVERQLREDTILRDASAAAAARSSSLASRRDSPSVMSTNFLTTGSSTAGSPHHRRDEIVSEMATLLAQLEREEKEAERAAQAQRARLATTGKKIVTVVAPTTTPAGAVAQRQQTSPAAAPRYTDPVSPEDDIKRPISTASPSLEGVGMKPPLAAAKLGPTATDPPAPAASGDISVSAAAAPLTSSDSSLGSSTTAGSDWQARVDPSSGRTYYFNRRTKRTTWQVSDTDLEGSPLSAGGKPAALAAADVEDAATSSPIRSSSESQKPLADGWREVKDDQGRPYYFHRESKRTTRRRAEAEEPPSSSTTAVTSPLRNAGDEVQRVPPQPPNSNVLAATETTGTQPPPTGALVSEKKSVDDKKSVEQAAVIRPAPESTSIVAPPAPAHSEHHDKGNDKDEKEVKKTVDTAPLGNSSSTARSTTQGHAASHLHPSEIDEHLITDPEQTKRENEARKAALEKKKEEDKTKISVGGMSMMEALRKAQEEEASTIKKLPKGFPVVASSSPSSPSAPGEEVKAASEIAKVVQVQPPAGVDGSSSPSPQATAQGALAGNNSSKPVVAPGGTIFGSWKECYSKEHQRKFYKHIVSGETTWKEPEEVTAAKLEIERKEGAAVAATVVMTAAKPPTVVAQTPAPPAAAASPAKPHGGTTMYGAWKEIFNEEKQKPFYKNVETGESTWKVPPEVAAMKEAAAAAAAASPSVSSPAPAAPRVKGDWKELFDANKGKCYYVNTQTKERTWDISKTSFA